MKKIFFLLVVFSCINAFAQDDKKLISQITVSGEGKVNVTPDIAVIQLGVQSSGKEATEVKKQNDIIINKVIKYIKSHSIPESDFQTTQMNLYKNYDYQTKKNTYQANQTITVTLKNLKKYEEFMMNVMDTGLNGINQIEFKSSKIEFYQSEARKKAILDAKKKAEDYVSALNQKIGKAIMISDTNQGYFPQPFYKGAVMDMESAPAVSPAPAQTLAVGEIEITANVQVSFYLD